MSSNFVNHELKIAESFVKDTSCNIFLTGKAGTGKTTFLKNLIKDKRKRMIVTAPTGVAAVNAGGVTLHSFFQLPFGPYIPGTHNNDSRNFRFNREKKNIIKSLDILVIDEISMVRGDLLDSVDEVLRRFRNNHLPFGGVQLLMIGDLHQLPPVVKAEDRKILKDFYDSPYFFSSIALKNSDLTAIELKHIYRQSDEKFINILNKIRENRLDSNSVEELHKRYIKGFIPKKDQGYITLTTHNSSADTINEKKLAELDSELHVFGADVTGDFPEHTYPAPFELELKKGAQVMFLRNDYSDEKAYYNGKVGKITEIHDDFLVILCPGESDEIILERASWENIKYSFNNETMDIEEEIAGRFVQFPVKLAWAITIHKSQGLTFDKVIIDAKDAFAHGQTYVAMSRCKTLDGIILSSKISSSGIEKDIALKNFDEYMRTKIPDEACLEKSKKAYQEKILMEAFNLDSLNYNLKVFIDNLLENKDKILFTGFEKINPLTEKFRDEIYPVSRKFIIQLQGLLSKFPSLPDENPHIEERIIKASSWFQDKFNEVFETFFEDFYFESDNADLEDRLDRYMEDLKKETSVKFAGIRSFENGFSPKEYLKAVSKAEIEISHGKIKKTRIEDYSLSDLNYPELYLALRNWRVKKAKFLGVGENAVVHQKVLINISNSLPENIKALKRLKGVGKKTLDSYGKEILQLVLDYRSKIYPETGKFSNFE